MPQLTLPEPPPTSGPLVFGCGVDLEQAFLAHLREDMAQRGVRLRTVLVPTAAQGQRLLDLAAQEGLGLGLECSSAEQAAALLAGPSSSGRAEFSPGLRLLLAESCLVSRRGEGLGSLANRSGLQRALAATLRDLTDGLADQDSLRSGAGRELAALFEHQEAWLKAADVHDGRALLTEGAASIEQGATRCFAVFGYYDATAAQEQFLLAWMRAGAAVFMPHVDELAEEWSRPFLERLRTAAGASGTSVTEPGAQRGIGPRWMGGRMAVGVSGDADEASSLGSDARRILSVPGGDEGLRAVARELVRLFDERDDLAPSACLVTWRGPDVDPLRLARFFERAGIPVAPVELPLAQCRAAAPLRSLCSVLEGGRMTRDQLFDWLGSLPAGSEQLGFDLADLAWLEAFGVKAGWTTVFESQDEDVLRRVFASLVDAGKHEERATRWGKVLRRIEHALDPGLGPDGSHCWERVSDKWIEVMRWAVPPESEGFERVIAVLSRMAHFDSTGIAASPERASRILVAEWSSETLPGLGAVGGVRLLNLQRARGSRARLCVLLDASEGVFPRRHGGDPLLGEQAVRTLGVRQQAWLSRLDPLGEDRVLFARLLEMAEDGLWLVTPRKDPHGAGGGAVPSRFATHLARQLTGERPSVADWIEGLPVPGVELLRSSDPASGASPVRAAADRVECVEALVEAERRVAPRRARGRLRAFLTGLSSDPVMRRGLQMEDERFEHREFGPFDGLLSAEVASAVDGLLPARRLISPTALEQYAACPRRFFFKRVLRIPGLDVPDEREGIDARKKGTLVHTVLQRFGEECSALDELPFCRGEFEAQRERLRKILAEELEQVHRSDLASNAQLWLGMRTPLERQLVRWLVRERAQGERWKPVAFEWNVESFAYQVDASDPVEIKGQVDRVDVHQDGLRVRVIDYKTGASAKLKVDSVEEGRQLQLPLYAAAASSNADFLPGGGLAQSAAQGAYSFLRDGRLKTWNEPGPKTDKGSKLQTLAQATVAELVSAREAGRFHLRLQGTGKSACAFCEFERACGPTRDAVWELKQGEDDSLERLKAIGKEAK